MVLEQSEIKYKDKVVFERLIMKGVFSRVPKLFTEDEACFLYLTKGAFKFRTPVELLTFTDGDGMLSKCGNYFIENISLNPSKEPQEIFAIGAFFYPTIVKPFFETDLSLEPFVSLKDTSKIAVEPLLKAFIDGLNFMFDNPSVADENLVITKLKELLILLSKSEKAASVSLFVQSLFEKKAYDFKEIIQKNVYADLTIDELAYVCNMSAATFKRQFASVFNTSPAKYFLLKKIEKAKQLLLVKNKPVAEIAFECGFDSSAAFGKSFKKLEHLTPSEYRVSQTDKSLS